MKSFRDRQEFACVRSVKRDNARTDRSVTVKVRFGPPTQTANPLSLSNAVATQVSEGMWVVKMTNSSHPTRESTPLQSTQKRSRVKTPFVFTMIIAALGCIYAWSVFLNRWEDSVSSKEANTPAEHFRIHRDRCLRLPESVYHVDRSRAVHGIVTDTSGKPLAGVRVYSIAISQLANELAKSRGLISDIKHHICRATETNEKGAYEFPSHPIGAYTLLYSSRDYAPFTYELAIVQDGVRTNLDAVLKMPRTLTVTFAKPTTEPIKLTIVPNKWWLSTTKAIEVSRDTRTIEISQLGGPFDSGIILVSSTTDGVSLAPVGQFDLSLQDHIVVDLSRRPQGHIPEFRSISGIEFHTEQEADLRRLLKPKFRSLIGLDFPGRKWTLDERIFYGISSPAVTLLTVPAARHDSVGSARLRLPEHSEVDRRLGGRQRLRPEPDGSVRGFGVHAFLPILLESSSELNSIAWASDAAEFFIYDLPQGYYRARAVRSSGRYTFSRGVSVKANGQTRLATTVNDWVDYENPLSREVMGFVRWENGQPAGGATVVMQNLSNFRAYLQSATTDEHGYFRFARVPPHANYFLFAAPDKSGNAMKNFAYLSSHQVVRESWSELVVYPHEADGVLAKSSKDAYVRILHQNGKQELQIWSTLVGEKGAFRISNLPHGRYVALGRRTTNAEEVRSKPFDINDKHQHAHIQWQ